MRKGFQRKISRWNWMLGVVSIIFLVTGSILTGCSVLKNDPNFSLVSSQAEVPHPQSTPNKAGLESGALQTSDIALEETGTSTRQISQSLLSFSSGYDYRPQTDNYDGLMTKEAKQLYRAIEERAYQISDQQHSAGYYSLGQITMSRKVSDDQIRMAITAFKNDNPQVFWIANVYSKAYSENQTIVRLYSYVSAAECNRMIQELNQEVKQILSDLEPGLPELDREIALFDRIAQRCTYDTNAAKNPSLWKSYTIYGLLVDGKAVCEGYARAMQLLLSYADMECRLINGEAGGTVHMWNLVKVDGKWYHMDPTWNDEDVVVRYDYFNVSDKVIQKDHTPSVDVSTMDTKEIEEYLSTGTASYNLPMPVCDSDNANYLKQKGVLIASFNKASDTRVVEALVEAAEEKRPAVYLYIGEDMTYSMAINQIFNSQPYKLASYVDQANRKLDDDHQIRYERITYILGENSRGITLKLAYNS